MGKRQEANWEPPLLCETCAERGIVSVATHLELEMCDVCFRGGDPASRRRGRVPRRFSKQVTEMKRRYAEGESLAQIAEALGCVQYTVYYNLRRAGVTFRHSRGGRAAAPTP